MPSPLIQFRLKPELEEALRAKALPGESLNLAAQRILGEALGSFAQTHAVAQSTHLSTPVGNVEMLSTVEESLQECLQRLREELTAEIEESYRTAMNQLTGMAEKLREEMDEKLGGDSRLGESDRLGEENETLRRQLEDAQSDIHELNRLWKGSRAEIEELRSQNAALEAEVERRNLAEGSWPWQCWAVRERDGKKEERLVASAPTRKEAEKKGGDFFVSCDTSVYPYEMGWRIEYRQDSEAYVLRHQLENALEEKKLWFARFETEKKSAAQAKFEQRSFLIALDNVAPKLAEKALAELNVGKQATVYKSAKRAIEQFVELAKLWARENASHLP